MKRPQGGFRQARVPRGVHLVILFSSFGCLWLGLLHLARNPTPSGALPTDATSAEPRQLEETAIAVRFPVGENTSTNHGSSSDLSPDARSGIESATSVFSYEVARTTQELDLLPEAHRLGTLGELIDPVAAEARDSHSHEPALAESPPPPPPPPPLSQPPSTGPSKSTQKPRGLLEDPTKFVADSPPLAGSGSKTIAVYFEGEDAPAHLRDVPCTLPGTVASARRSIKCKIECAAEKSRATEFPKVPCGVDMCKRVLECNAVILEGVTRGGRRQSASAFAVLKTDAKLLADDSMERLKKSPWWGKTALKTQPRMFVVASYGGSGSKMLSAFLKTLPQKFQASVRHIHDRFPPTALRAFAAVEGEAAQAYKPPEPRYVNVKPRRPSMEEIVKAKHRKKKLKGDARKVRFEGDERFRNDTEPVSAKAIGGYRVVFIYKDPSEALVSRYGHEHCLHIQGNCGSNTTDSPASIATAAATFPDLAEYAARGKDLMLLFDHYRAYVHPSVPRNYPVVCLNYHRLWDNLPVVMLALGLPANLASKFPPRTETVRTTGGDRHGGGGAEAASEDTRGLLRRMYRPLVDEITENPAVLVV